MRMADGRQEREVSADGGREGGGMRMESRVDGGGAGKGVSRENVVMPGQ